MSGTSESETTRVVESCVLADTWIDGIASIEGLSGGCYRFIFFRMRIDQSGRAYRETVASFVLHEGAVGACATQALAAIGRSLKDVTSKAVRVMRRH